MGMLQVALHTAIRYAKTCTAYFPETSALSVRIIKARNLLVPCACPVAHVFHDSAVPTSELCLVSRTRTKYQRAAHNV